MGLSLEIKTVLFATDFLESSRLALDYATAFAHHYQAKLQLLHVFHLPQPAMEAEALNGPSMSRLSRERRLERLAAGAARAGVEVGTQLVEGWMPQTLLEKIHQSKPDLLALGTHGIYRGLHHMLIGSNAEEVLLSVPYPTLTVGRHVPAGVGPEIEFEHILYITDFTPESAAAAPYAVALSHDFNARLEVCHLLPEQEDRGAEEDHMMETRYCEEVARMVPGSEASWCSPGAQLEHGATADQILQRIRRDSSGLVVLGVRAESEFARHLRTSRAFELVATAACPILTIRGVEAR